MRLLFLRLVYRLKLLGKINAIKLLTPKQLT
jgi:hypothetical protein